MLRRIVSYSDCFATRQAPLEAALHGSSSAAKLWPDITANAIILLERGHLALARKLERSCQTDLMVAEAGDVVLVEAKRYTKPRQGNRLRQFWLSCSSTFHSDASHRVEASFLCSTLAAATWLPLGAGYVPNDETLTIEEVPSDRVVVGYVNTSVFATRRRRK